MNKIENVPWKSEPVLLDRVLQELQDKMKARFPWLEVAYGRGYRKKDKVASGVSDYPAAYIGNGEYQSLLPDDRLSGFSWFDIYDPQVVDGSIPGLAKIRVEGALIIWYRLDKIFSDADALYTEEIKNDVLRFLTSSPLENLDTFVVTEVREKAENIYKGYDVRSWDEQFLSYPYAGLRIEFEMNVQEACL